MYGMESLVSSINQKEGKNILANIKNKAINYNEAEWVNLGGQLIPQKSLQTLLSKIKNDQIESWDQIHEFYEVASSKYLDKRKNHALVALELITKKKLASITNKQLMSWLDDYLVIKSDIANRIEKTRAKDYSNPFRKMVYQNEAEMIAVVGDLKDNGFIKEQNLALKAIELNIAAIKTKLKIK